MSSDTPASHVDSSDTQFDWDPVYLHSRRELIAILVIFGGACVWALTVSWVSGYTTDAQAGEQIAKVLGMPRWVFWGVFVPWIAADVATIWFCFFYMKDDDLDASSDTDISRETEQ